MRELERPAGINRRTFVQGIGLAAGAVLTMPPWSWLPSAEASSGIKIGVLLPQSKLCPQLPGNILAGMRLGFDLMQPQAEQSGTQLIVETISPEGSGAEVRAAKLLDRDKVDAVVGVISESVAARLSGLFSRAGVPLVVSTVGANIVRQDELDPYTFHASLDIWRASWAMGEWAAANLGSGAVMAASFYESGFDALWAFHAGFEESGGKILESFVTHLSTSPMDIVSVVGRIAEIKPDFVFASYCGKDAADFVKTYADAGLAEKIPLSGSSFLADEAILPVHCEAARQIRTCLPWSSNMDTPANKLFTSVYYDRTGHAPDIFGLLGYDTAQLVGKAWRAAGGTGRGNAALAETLACAENESPRGLVRMGADTSGAGASIYLREVRQQGGMWRNEVIAELPPVSDCHSSIRAIRMTPRSGWIAPYLFV
jgi:branched-chain amino acid transport system substrate-binding protein